MWSSRSRSCPRAANTKTGCFKPELYAANGIPHYWRVERDPTRIHIYALDGSRYSEVTQACAGGELHVQEPWEYTLPLRNLQWGQ